MYCTQCGAELPDNASFCTLCGHRVDARIAGSASSSIQTAAPGWRAQADVSVQTPSTDTATAPKSHAPLAIVLSVLGVLVAVVIGVLVFTQQPVSSDGSASQSQQTSSVSVSSGSQSTTEETAPADSSTTSLKDSELLSDSSSSAASSSSAEKTDTFVSGTYANGRYGYSVALPSGFTQQSSSSNGDGSKFYGSSLQMTVVAYGSNNLDSYDAAGFLAYWLSGHTASYQTVQGSMCAGSYVSGSTICYMKAYVGSGSIDVIEMQYPQSQKAAADGSVTSIAKSLSAGNIDSAC